jgi:Flp pilus assembly pilin Flp
MIRSRLQRSAGLFSRFWREKGGASATEYALLLGIIASGIALAAGTLGSAISIAMDAASTCIAQGPDCSP